MIERREAEQPAPSDNLSKERFNPELLRTARGARGLTQTEFAERIGVKQNAVSRWEDGIRVPSATDIEKIAHTLGRIPEFFYQDDRLCGVDTAFLFHRKRKKTPITILNQIQDRINLTLISLRRLRRNVDDWPIRFERMDVDDERFEGPEQIARLVRAMWQLPFGPIPDLVSLVESAGSIVYPMDFGTDDVDAVGVWPWDMPPMFFLNPNVPAERARFNLAHEIAHVVMHCVPTPEMEDQADAFASELLMPTRDVVGEFAGMTFERAIRMKLRWRTSAQAIIRKSKDVGAISVQRYKSLFVYLSGRGFRKREPNPISPELPTTVSRLAAAHLDDMEYDVSDLMRATFYMDEQEFRREILLERPKTFGVVWH